MAAARRCLSLSEIFLAEKKFLQNNSISLSTFTSVPFFIITILIS